MHAQAHDNLALTEDIVKGKYYSRTTCIDLQSFILIKSRRTGWYDYVPGNAGILFSDDIPQAEYFLRKNAKWEHNTDCYLNWKKQQERK